MMLNGREAVAIRLPMAISVPAVAAEARKPAAAPDLSSSGFTAPNKQL
jgi:hypothetical protein